MPYMRTLSLNLEVLFAGGKAYRNLATTVFGPMRFSDRASPSLKEPSRVILWPETLEEAIQVMEVNYGFTIRFESKPWMEAWQGSARLTFENRAKIIEDDKIPEHYKERCSGCYPSVGCADTAPGFLFRYVFQDGGKWFRSIERMGQINHDIIINDEWLPALKERWGWRE
jgi:hypothetical protein